MIKGVKKNPYKERKLSKKIKKLNILSQGGCVISW